VYANTPREGMLLCWIPRNINGKLSGF